MGTPIALGLLAVVVGWAVVKILRGGLGDAKFVVSVAGPGTAGIAVKGDVPGKSVGEVTEFVAGLELPKGARIWAVPDGERMQLRFSSDVPDNLQQRLRNYFYNAW